MALQHRPQGLQALAISACQGIVDPVQTPVDPLKRCILIGRRLVALKKAVDAGVQHYRVTAHVPAHGLGAGHMQLALDPQLGHDLGPAFGNRLLDHGQVKNPGLDHLQHIFDRQRRVDPLDFDRRQLTQGQLLVDLMQGIAGGT
ncbi:hypothetical protein D3C79_745960 [compost metagenome]